MMKFVVRVLAALGLTVGGLGAAQAAPMTMSVSGSAVSLSSLGDAIGTDFDKINVHPFGPASISVPPGVPTTVTLSEFDFIVGINAHVPQAGYSYTLTVPFTFNGVSGVLSQPFVLDIDTSDTLTFLTGTPAVFDVPGAGRVQVTLSGQSSVTVGPISGTYMGNLRAEVLATPEPATLAVCGGIALAGAVGSRRRKAGA